MATVKSYAASVERDGRFWLIHVPALGRYTQARSLREVEPVVRDLIATMLELDAATFTVTTDLVLPDGARHHLAAADRLRKEAASANSAAAREVRSAARELAQAGLTLRDIGAALNVSHQRAHQLLQDDLQPTS